MVSSSMCSLRFPSDAPSILEVLKMTLVLIPSDRRWRSCHDLAGVFLCFVLRHFAEPCQAHFREGVSISFSGG